jgi:CIC family chloride channel protein
MSEAPPTRVWTAGSLEFSLIAVAVGVVAGVGAVVFRGLIALFHNLFFLGRLSVSYEANVHTPIGPWGPFIILGPVIGALFVVVLVKHFAPEAKGHGVIRPVVAVIKALASALSIGSGGSVGREGPIIQIGSSFGSTSAQLLRLPVWQRITLIAAGAGGGIAATFNTPVGGVLFALEIMMHEVSARTLVPVAIATATATWIGRLFLGTHPSFVIPALETLNFRLMGPLALLAYVGLGALAGLVSALYIRAIYGTEDFFERRVRGGPYVRHMLGMAIVGVMIWMCARFLGHYHVEGVGYATVQDILTGKLALPAVLVLLFALKLAATSLTLGSGASGGVFSPALFMGATLGGTYGLALGALAPSLAGSAPAFAVAGMAGVVGGSTGAAMAAIVMIFEMTLDYNVVLPMTITVAVSYGVRRWLMSDTIYTMKLSRRGLWLPNALQTDVHLMPRARDLLDAAVVVTSLPTSPAGLAAALDAHPGARWLVIEREGRVDAVIECDEARTALDADPAGARLAARLRRNLVVVAESARLYQIIPPMRESRALFAVVRREGQMGPAEVLGVISRERIAGAVMDATDIFS